MSCKFLRVNVVGVVVLVALALSPAFTDKTWSVSYLSNVSIIPK